MKIFRSDDSHLSPEAKRLQYAGGITFISVSLIIIRLTVETIIDSNSNWLSEVLQGVTAIILLHLAFDMLLGGRSDTAEGLKRIVVASAVNCIPFA